MPRLRRKMWGRQGRPVGFPDVRGSQWNSIQNSSDLISSWIKTLELSWMFQWWTELWIELWFYPYSPWTMGSQGATKWVSQLQLNDRLVSWESIIVICQEPVFCHWDMRLFAMIFLLNLLNQRVLYHTGNESKWQVSASTMELFVFVVSLVSVIPWLTDFI